MPAFYLIGEVCLLIRLYIVVLIIQINLWLIINSVKYRFRMQCKRSKNFQAKRWQRDSLFNEAKIVWKIVYSRHLEIWFSIIRDRENNDFIARTFRKGKNMIFRLEEVFRDDANELQKSSIFEYAILVELLNNSWRQEDPDLGTDIGENVGDFWPFVKNWRENQLSKNQLN